MKTAKKHLDVAMIELKNKLESRGLHEKVATFLAEGAKEVLTEKQIKQLIIELLQ